MHEDAKNSDHTTNMKYPCAVVLQRNKLFVFAVASYARESTFINLTLGLLMILVGTLLEWSNFQKIQTFQDLSVLPAKRKMIIFKTL